MAESDTWKGKENLKNTKKEIKEFEKKYQQDMKDVTRQEHEKGTFRKIAKKIYSKKTIWIVRQEI